MQFGINVFDFGAKGDGVTDDTQAIQSAINYAAERGGGKILFPYTPGGYRIASPAIEEYDGKPLRSQLVIPPGNGNICLEGEMPCRMGSAYSVRSLEALKHKILPTRFQEFCDIPFGGDNTRIFSDWEAPEEHDGTARPWSIISAPEGEMHRGNFSVLQFSIVNLDFRVPVNLDKMYPTQSAVNLQNVARVNISDSQFAIGESMGDYVLEKELLPNPCHTAGLITSADQNDNNVLRNVAIQGFRYGLVSGENVVSEYLYFFNCEEALTFHDCSHLSVFNHIVAHHNAVVVSTAEIELFGMPKGECNVQIGTIDFESGIGQKPAVSQLRYGVLDRENRLRRSLKWFEPWGPKKFPTICSDKFKVIEF